jgi:hypothetical protein
VQSHLFLQVLSPASIEFPGAGFEDHYLSYAASKDFVSQLSSGRNSGVSSWSKSYIRSGSLASRNLQAFEFGANCANSTCLRDILKNAWLKNYQSSSLNDSLMDMQLMFKGLRVRCGMFSGLCSPDDLL